MSLGFLLALFALGFVLSFLFSGFETGIYALSAVRFELRRARREAAATRLADHLANMPRVIATVLLGNNVANYLLTASSMALLTAFAVDSQAELLNTLLLGPFIFVFSEVLPKEFFRRHADSVVYRLVRLYGIFAFLSWPISLVLSRIPELLKGLRLVPDVELREKPTTLERFSIELTRGPQDGTLTQGQVTMAQRIMALRERKVLDVTVPLNKIAWVSETTSLAELQRLMTELPYTRLVVTRGTPDSIIGIVWVYDVCLGEPKTMQELIRPIPKVDAEAPIDVALSALRSAHAALAVVKDRRDRSLGIVTLKDLVGEIVTDLHDL